MKEALYPNRKLFGELMQRNQNRNLFWAIAVSPRIYCRLFAASALLLLREASFPPVQPKSYPEAGDVAEIEVVCAWCLEDAVCLHQLWCCLREASFRFLRVLVSWFLGFLVS